MSKEIKVTENFRLLQESDQYIVQQLMCINPKDSPRFNPEKHSSEKRYEWRNTSGCYFGLSASGLEAAIKSIMIKEAGLNDSEEVSLVEYLESLREISNVVHKAVECIR